MKCRRMGLPPPATPARVRAASAGIPAPRDAFQARERKLHGVTRNDQDASSTALGILVPEFPQQTHIFFWREIVALRKLGVRVRLYSTRRAAAGACRHAFAEAAAAETHYTFPPRMAT